MFETFLGIRDPGTTALQHLFAMAQLARLKRQADVEMRIVSIPGDWSPPVPGVFIKESMNNLADLGERMGADPASWSDKPHLRILKRPAARTVRAQC